jgi:hypothetical protein
MKSKILLLFLILTFITCKNKPSENIIDENFCDEQLELQSTMKVILVELKLKK